MIIRKPNDIPSSEITPEALYVDRRRFLKLGAMGAVGATVGACSAEDGAADDGRRLERSAQEKPTEYQHITSYNNFYEFGPDKGDPAENAPKFLKPRPWTVVVEGLCAKPGRYALEDFIKPSTLEDRVYRLRCVEGWSMVIPWRGFPLADVIRRAQPTAQAKYVELYTLLDPAQMPYQKTNLLEWPYIEGLRLDEALHPLALLATGLYGRDLPAQNGAPLRLVVPWKYGFKSVKSIVRMRFVEAQPTTTWMQQAPHEYGFYSNVNPNVDHPRWSQKKERRIPALFKSTDTLIFNGYGDQVARLYEGMDLKKYY